MQCVCRGAGGRLTDVGVQLFQEEIQHVQTVRLLDKVATLAGFEDSGESKAQLSSAAATAHR